MSFAEPLFKMQFSEPDRVEKNTNQNFAAHYLLIGTPASWSARHPPHTVAMLELPLLSVIVLSILIVNGNSSKEGDVL